LRNEKGESSEKKEKRTGLFFWVKQEIRARRKKAGIKG